MLVVPSEEVLEGRGPPSNPRALACLVLRDSELAYLFRSLIKLSPPPPFSLSLSAVVISRCAENGAALSEEEEKSLISRFALGGGGRVALLRNPRFLLRNVRRRRSVGKSSQWKSLGF